MKATGFRMTIRGIMITTALVAGFLGFRSYLGGWESRRAVMYRQRDATRVAMAELPADIAAAGLPSAGSRRSGDDRTYTTHWSEQLEAWDTQAGTRQTLFRATVSGANGRFSLPPVEILVESNRSPLEGLWLDRLFRAYRGIGCRYTVTRRPLGSPPDGSAHQVN